MNRFNLVFRGDIKAGKHPEKVRAGFASLFNLDDPSLVEPFFSGETVVLRRNLDRKEAAEYFQKLQHIGAIAELVKVAGLTAAGDDQERALQRAAAKAKRREAEAARQAELEIAQLRKAREEQRRRDEKTRIRAEQQARVEQRAAAARAEKQRKAEAQAAERAAKQAEKERLAQEKAARLAKEKAEKQRAAAARAARIAAEREEQERAAAEHAAKQAQAREQREREAQIRAAERAERKALERQQAAAEKARQQQAEREAKRLKEQQKAARLEAQQLEQQRLAEEQAERRRRAKAEKRQLATEKAARIAAEKAERRRAAAAEAERISTEQARQRHEREALRRSLEDDSRAAQDYRLQKTAKRFSGQSEFLSGSLRNGQGAAVAGEPNLYALHPFRNSREVQQRAQTALRLRGRAVSAALTCLGAILVLLGLRLQLMPPPLIEGPVSGLATPQGQLLLALDDRLLLHDRSGTPTGELRFSQLGLSSPGPLLAANATGDIVYLSGLSSGLALAELHACPISGDVACRPLGKHTAAVDAIVANPTDQSLVAAAGGENRLLRLSAEGELMAEADVMLPASADMVIDSGLLYITAAEGPATGVYRYDAMAFGQQLDQLLLMPPPALERELSRVAHLKRAADSWWAVLTSENGSTSALLRFNDQWDYLGEARLPSSVTPDQLLPWGQRMLVLDRERIALDRFNAQGQTELPLRSTSLLSAAEQRRSWQHWSQTVWRLVLLAVLTSLVYAVLLAYLQHLRTLVYRQGRCRGAAPLEGVGEDMLWLKPRTDRAHAIRRAGIAYTCIALPLLALAASLDLTGLQLCGLTILAAGPALALWMLYQAPAGHVAVTNGQFLLVDHNNMYHHGKGPELQYRGNFLLIDDVVVFLGNRLLPQFEGAQATAKLARSGIRVDRGTLAIKMLQTGHPFARGAIAMLAAVTLGMLLLAI
ncbi:MAG: hypothetical protein AAGI11_12085 [Pseudomonadota bacterium]